MNNLIVHVIPHSHLDREWYMGFEKHRARLLTLMEDLMEIFEKDPEYKCFHMDGQTIALDDYLEVHPEKREKVEQLVKEGRLSAGPWYILQDEFLTSGESNIRNLLTGLREAKAYGKVCPIGYFPDAFGNAGQMPQILKQAGMEAIVYGRGVRTTGPANVMGQGGKYDSTFSEMYWQSPDGSMLPSVLFASWYNNGAEIPVDRDKAKIYWDKKLEQARKSAGTRHLLFMNGCDHQPVQKDLSQALQTARELYPEITFVQTDFPSYMEAMLKELPENASVISGELTSQETDGIGTLVNTCSNRADLKRLNMLCESLLEKVTEPLTVMGSLYGIPYDEKYLQHAWKKLMQNHPHDSICGCSVDEVNRGIEERFAQSMDAAGAMADEIRLRLAMKIAEDNDLKAEEGKVDFALFSSDLKERKENVCVTVDLFRIWGELHRSYLTLKEKELPKLVLKNAKGEIIPAVFEDAGTSFGYTLPSDRFRRPYVSRKVRVTFEAETMGAGYQVYSVETVEEENCPAVTGSGKHAAKVNASMISYSGAGEILMENDRIRVCVHEDGSYSVTEKASGRSYEKVGYYEDAGDIGNEYIFKEASDKKRVTTLGRKAQIEVAENDFMRAKVRILQEMEIPESAEEMLDLERASMVWPPMRVSGRSDKLSRLVIETELQMDRNSRTLKVTAKIHNRQKDHRLQVIFPTGIQSDHHYADSVLEVVKRPNRHSERWINESGCEHVQRFALMEDEKGGLMAGGIGTYEYEILPERDNAIALTLLRATGEMGDWGDFPTPEAQMLKDIVMEYALMPFGKDEREEAVTEGYRISHPYTFCQLPVGVMGNVPPEEEKEKGLKKVKGVINQAAMEEVLIGVQGDFIVPSGLKMAENGKDIVLRFFNSDDKTHTLQVNKPGFVKKLFRSSVIEEKLEEVKEERGAYKIEVRPFEILTLLMEK